MSWLALLKLLLSLANQIAQFAQVRQAIEAGEAQATLKILEALNGQVDKAVAARNAVLANGGLRDHDWHERPDG